MTGDGGGYILAASHTIPPETPLENIFAMYHEAGVTREEAFDRAAGILRQVGRGKDGPFVAAMGRRPSRLLVNQPRGGVDYQVPCPRQN